MKSRERGRPEKFKPNEKWGRTTVVLRDWEVAFLDRLAADIREKSGAALNRSDLIREAIGVLVSAHNAGLLKLSEIPEQAISGQLGTLIQLGRNTHSIRHEEVI